MFSFFQKTDPNEIKSLCCRATERIKLISQQYNAQVANDKKDVVAKFKRGEVELAQIKVEGIIYTKRSVAAIQLLSVYINTLNSRIEYLLHEKTIPANMEGCIGSILACKGRFDIPELSQICEFLENRYKKMVTMLVNGCDTRISSRLVPSVPSPTEVDAEMEDILKKNGIDYIPSNHPTIMDPNGNGSVTPNPFNNPATISPIPTVSPMQTSPFPAPQFPPTLQPSLPPFPNTNGGSFSNPPSNSVFPTL